MKHVSLGIALWIASCIPAMAWTKQDSLEIKQRIDLAEKTAYTDNTEAIRICHEALSLARAKDYALLDNYAYNVLGRIYSSDGNIDSSTYYFEKAIELSKKYNDQPLLCATYCDYGSLLVFESRHTEAIEYFSLSLELAEKIRNDELAFYNLYYIADLYFTEKNVGKSFEYGYRALLKLNGKDERYDYHRGSIYDHLGKTFTLYKDYNRAKVHLEKSLFYFQKIDDAFGIANTTLDYGLNEFALNPAFDTDTLIARVSEANRIFNELAPESRNNINCLNLLTELYLKKEDYTIALRYADEAETFAAKTGFISALIESKRLKSLIYAHTDRYQQAYQYQTAFTRLNDSLYSQEHKNEIAEVESRKDIIIRDQIIENKSLEIQAKERQKIFLSIGIILLVIIGALLWWQNQNRKKTNRILQQLNAQLDLANKNKVRFLGILNHDLRGPVAKLIDFLHLQRDSPDLMDEQSQKRFEEMTLKSAENLLSSMEDLLLWSKSQMDHFQPQYSPVELGRIAEDLEKLFSGYQHIAFDYRGLAGITAYTDGHYLKTILRNLTYNAIKAVEQRPAPVIAWKAWQENQTLFISVTDNGSGASEDKFKALFDDTETVGISSGLGLHLVRDLAKAIQCRISVKSEMGGGTRILLEMPAQPSVNTRE